MKKYLFNRISISSKNIQILFFVCLSFASISSAFGQQTKVKGKVIDSKTNEAIPFVNIIVVGTKQGIQTDINGNFLCIFIINAIPQEKT